MNIIFDTEHVEEIKNNNIVLELDTFYFAKLNKTTTAYCVVDNIKITDIDKIEHNQKLHNELLDAYKNKNFDTCQNLLEHLQGAFNGEVDSFYFELNKRIEDFKTKALPGDWNSIIVRED
jgi:hypothetical protein